MTAQSGYIPVKQAQRIRRILKQHGLRFRSFSFGRETEFLLIALKPLANPELSMVGKWYTAEKLRDLVDNLEDADITRREELKAERKEERQNRPPFFYW